MGRHGGTTLNYAHCLPVSHSQDLSHAPWSANLSEDPLQNRASFFQMPGLECSFRECSWYQTGQGEGWRRLWPLPLPGQVLLSLAQSSPGSRRVTLIDTWPGPWLQPWCQRLRPGQRGKESFVQTGTCGRHTCGLPAGLWGAAAREYRAEGSGWPPTCPGFWLCVLEGLPLREWEFPSYPALTQRQIR